MKNKRYFLFGLLINLALCIWQLIDLNRVSDHPRQVAAEHFETKLTLLDKTIESHSLALGRSPSISDAEPSHHVRWQNRQLHVPLDALDDLMIRPFKQWEFELTDQACDLFEITPAQRARINKTLKDTLAQVVRIEEANSKLIEDEDGSQYYEIYPYREQAIGLDDELQEALTTIVGVNLATILAAKSHYLFADMGRLRQQVYIEEKENDEFFLTHRAFGPDGEEIGSLIGAYNREVASTRFGHLLQPAE